jgi:hypothetical protein
MWNREGRREVAGGFAASFEDLALAIPELADDLRLAGREPGWVNAATRAAELWGSRAMRGEVDDPSVAAAVVFVGANLVIVNADGERLTFRFDTRDFDRTASISVSGWYLTPAATRRALRLTSGRMTWHFDPNGAFVRTSLDDRPSN